MSNLDRLVLELNVEGDEVLYFAHSGPFYGPERLCEMCDPDDGDAYVADDVATYGSATYRDADLMIRERQTGGEPDICEECLVERILGDHYEYAEKCWSDEATGRWFVRPDGPLPEPTLIVGGS